ncbi:MAG: DUF3300 domain-containing protein [Pseudomonadales bacterium]|jgi:hypothetical protein|nr:DUF3300 domain-containing protein [Gammaproteobacteria bacterium]MBP6050559.1 DUF3300 domain-containing protein [Pseudomonadales bacterium]MBK6583407.1 DUF3300 domain-containing protein [Gammaproteobacteria bacterium]MBK7521130.1 DUF3300 domain-containing protein [Gammaproteobacteria bacterium]MBK8306818.1 DUF3300 domain-containing protein [Gammaproteobacteria bacterium]
MSINGFRGLPLMLVLAAGMQLTGCSDDKEASATTQMQSSTAGAAVAGSTMPDAANAWSAESLEELLAPIALYPDPVLAQVLATSANPQEVLDAGNWLLQNEGLAGKALETAATAAGFTPPMVAMVQFPTVVDMMCMEMDWTTELGSAFQADEPGVLSAVQRLRVQARDIGNLQSSEQMKVVTEERNNQQVVVVEPADPQIVYVPQYNPTTVYTTPPPAAAAVAPAAAVETGHSTGTLITTGLLAFGAGILVNEMFDDDDHHDNYYPAWGYGGGGYYPPPYRPVYGGGFHPAYGYNRPPNYQHGFNNNNVIINTGGNDYWNRFDNSKKNNYRNKAQSPISAARPNRPELQQRANAQPAARQQAGAWKGQGSYAGAQQGNRPKGTEARSPTARPATTPGAKKPPSGSYAGAKPATRQQPAGARDRGRSTSAAARPATKPATAPAANRSQQRQLPSASNKAQPSRASGFQQSQGSGKADRAASQRGRSSMSQGAKPQQKARSAPKRGK